MATDLHDLSIAELSRLIAARKLSPVDLVEALIQRIEQYDGQTRAFIHIRDTVRCIEFAAAKPSPQMNRPAAIRR